MTPEAPYGMFKITGEQIERLIEVLEKIEIKLRVGGNQGL